MTDRLAVAEASATATRTDAPGLFVDESELTIVSPLDVPMPPEPLDAAAPTPTGRKSTRKSADGESYNPSHRPGSRPRTELGNAERLVDSYGKNIRYVPQKKAWLVWDERRWCRDRHGSVNELAKKTIRSIVANEGADAADWAHTSESSRHLAAAVRLAETDPAVVVDEARLDNDAHLLGVTNGTVDLRTGELLEPDRTHLITKQAGTKYDPTAQCPKWLAFLNEAMLGDQGMISYLQTLAGYSASGSTEEHLMVVGRGGGRNGKGIFQELIAAALGEYAQTMPAATLVESRSSDGSGPSPDIARLRGARFVQTSETAAAAKLAEAKVKSLTSSDTQVARHLNQGFEEFPPTHTIWLATNYALNISGRDKGIWSRIRLINWDYTVPEARKNLKLGEELRDELPGILAWIVEGARRWYAHGLQTPHKVEVAVADYKAEMDFLADFVDQECVTGEDAVGSANDLYKTYRTWALNAGEQPVKQRAFGMLLSERGYARKQLGKQRRWHWLGIAPRAPWDGVSDPFDTVAAK